MESWNGIDTFYAKDQKAWRSWLQKNASKKKSVWLIIYKKGAATKSISYAEAVEEALCFGWIDSKANKRDGDSFYQSFAQRNPKSNWSRINKERVEQLISDGRMTLAGLTLIQLAKENGSWSALDKIERLELPVALQELLSKNANAATFFDAFPRSVKKGILEWIQNARTSETREKRIAETVRLAGDNIRANRYKAKG